MVIIQLWFLLSGKFVCVCSNAITKTSKLNMIRAKVKVNLDGQKMIKTYPYKQGHFLYKDLHS